MTASAEQAALLADPTTSAATLQSLAAADPDLWPAIAAHPNVYPDLLDWMHENGLAETAPVEEPAPDVVDEPLPEEPELEGEPEVAEESDDDLDDHDPLDGETPDDDGVADEAPTEALTAALPAAGPLSFPSLQADRLAHQARVRTWVAAHRRVLIAVGGGIAAAILAIVLVVNLIVVPQQQAAEAAAEAAEAYADAVDDFDDAVSACNLINRQLTTEMGRAEEKTSVDVNTLADPAVVDELRTAISDAEGTEPCSSPDMTDETDAIVEQTRLIKVDTARVDRVVRSITAAISAVGASAAEKEQQVAAAAAAAQAAAEAAALAARTWTMSDSQGYGFTASLAVDAPTTSASGTIGNTLTDDGYSFELGDACGFDPAVDVAVPVKMTVTATTQGFDTDISALITIAQSGRVSTPHEVVVEAYFTEGPECKTPTYGSTILDGVHWAEPMATGASGGHQFYVIIRQWKTPATPNGDVAFLDNVSMRVSGGQGSTYGTSSNQLLFLSNRVK